MEFPRGIVLFIALRAEIPQIYFKFTHQLLTKSMFFWKLFCSYVLEMGKRLHGLLIVVQVVIVVVDT